MNLTWGAVAALALVSAAPGGGESGVKVGDPAAGRRAGNLWSTPEDQALLTLTHTDVAGIVDGHRFLDPEPDGPAMARQIAQARKMSFLFTPFNAFPVRVDFSVDGFDDHLASAAKACAQS